jgi:hypothetical protein
MGGKIAALLHMNFVFFRQSGWTHGFLIYEKHFHVSGTEQFIMLI